LVSLPRESLGQFKRSECALVRGLQSGRGLEQGSNTNIVVRRDPATRDMTAFSSTAGAFPDARGRPQMRWPMLEPWGMTSQAGPQNIAGSIRGIRAAV
jgi:hypothetical protein